MTDEEWRAWLAAPLTLEDRLRVELAELRRLHEEEIEERHQAVREAVARRAGRPSYAQLCERRGETARAERARWHERRAAAVFA